MVSMVFSGRHVQVGLLFIILFVSVSFNDTLVNSKVNCIFGRGTSLQDHRIRITRNFHFPSCQQFPNVNFTHIILCLQIAASGSQFLEN